MREQMQSFQKLRPLHSNSTVCLRSVPTSFGPIVLEVGFSGATTEDITVQNGNS